MSLLITKENYEAEVLNSDIPVVVDFWAAWCGPCKMMGPIIDKLSDDMAGKVKVGKINVDEEPELAAKYGIMSIPTIVKIEGGQEVGRSVGQRPLEVLKSDLGL